MAGTMKPGLKIIIFGALAVGIYFGAKYWQSRPKEVEKAQEVGHVSLPDAPEASLSGTATKIPIPGTAIAAFKEGNVKATHYEMEWMAQTAVNYANGGDQTTTGSLFDQAGWNINIVRQDDDSKSQQLMVQWIKDYHDGKTKDGVFVSDMGSQMDWYMGGIDSAVKSLGPEYQVVIFMAWGKSYGEDQLIVKPDIFTQVKNNPQTLRGKVIRGVRLGGDHDVLIKYCGDNGIPINPNEKLYDPNAVNLSYSADFLSAVVDYNANQSETRKLVKNGKTSIDTTVHMDGCVTWTPGDVNAANGIGGGTVISTKQYAAIMPCVCMTCKKFLSDNASKVQDLIAAFVQAGDQVRSFSDVKTYAFGLDAKIWNDKDANFWMGLYNGKTQGDMKLGGSMVYNLKDLVNEFGLQGNTDIYKQVYTTFKDLHTKLYPKELAGAPDYFKAVDKSYMAAVVSNHPELLEGKALKVDYSGAITTKVASKAVHVNFATGSATISPSSFQMLNEIASDAIASEGLKVGVYGHTDNTGDESKNVVLSEARAASVAQYLIQHGLTSERIESKGYGDAQPIADNNTAAGKAQNRRVEIALGN
jgi:OmpA-OmpF porin, OOP family